MSFYIQSAIYKLQRELYNISSHFLYNVQLAHLSSLPTHWGSFCNQSTSEKRTRDTSHVKWNPNRNGFPGNLMDSDMLSPKLVSF